jgi:putative DNA primase/helicase
MYDLSELERPEKPRVLPVILENIPEDIRCLPRWVLWQWELREDTQGKRRWAKVPYSGILNECDEHWNRAKSNDATTWPSFRQVVRHLRRFDGIGFMLGEGFSGIDLDKCRDPLTGEINEQDRQIIEEIRSYTDVSPSSTGVKILFRGQKPPGRCRVGTFEMYSEGRYFTVTGHHLPGTPRTVEDRQEEINRLHARMFPAPAKVALNGKSRTKADLGETPDPEILAAARSAKNADKFNKLWAGDWQALGYPSQSEADEALVGMLAFWCGPKADRIDALFRRSGLYRDKWERSDYRERTIARVLDSQEAYYQWPDQELRDLEVKAEAIVKRADTSPATRPEAAPTKAGPRDAFHYQRLAELFLEQSGLTLLKYQERFFVYRGTRYAEEKELNDKLRRFLLRNKVPHNNNLIGNVLAVIGSLVFKSAAEHPAMPFLAGKEPFPKPENIIAYRNGLLDVEKYLVGDHTLLPHTPKWVSTVCLPYDFDPEARCPTWESFLGQVFEGDTGKMNLLQEWFGYCLMHDTSQHKLMVLTGVPRSGKGTTMRVLEALVGAENSAGYNLHSLADKFGLRKLVGKLVAFVGEVNLANSRDKYRILETLNAIVGEDKVDVEEKFRAEGMSQKLPVRFVLACNDLPNFVDPSGALAARLLLLDYQLSFEGREDRTLEKKLLAEVSGVSNWALTGYARLRKNGTFTLPAKSQALVNEFRRENSDAYAFIQDCLVVERGIDPGNLGHVRFTDMPVSVSGKKLEGRYLQWCEENNIENPSLKWLCRNLKTILPKLGEQRPWVGAKRERVYHGIGLVQENPVQEAPAPAPPTPTDVLTEAQVQEFFASLKA